MYGGSTSFALVDTPYPPHVEAAARAGTLQPIDYTHQNSSYAIGGRGSHLHRERSRHVDPRAG